MLEKCLKKVDQKKEKLDELRPLPKELIKNLDDWLKIDLTYNSNAIEGNTLSPSETALVVEKGLTIGGKSVVEHLEAINHAYALDYIKEFASKENMLDNVAIKDIHSLVLKAIDDINAGRWRTRAVRISGSDVKLADPLKIPELMNDFEGWLQANEDHPIKKAADAHLKFVTIHPFVDGNGRTARLLMNLILMQYGYPIAVIKNENRKAYIDALETAQKTGDASNFYLLICNAINRSFDLWLDAASKTVSN